MSKHLWLVLGLSILASACGGDLPFDEPRTSNDPMDDGSDDGTNDGSGGPTCGGPDAESVALDQEEQRFLELLNQHRANNGRAPVVACTSLNRAAQLHSEDMRDQDYFDHSGLDGSSPGSRACDACFESCQSTGFGENIAAGNSDAESTFNQWLNSSGHNANMLRESYVVVGLGRATGGGRYRSYWTNVFATSSDPSCGN
jgi:uncharacterized protein YkwD